MGFFGSLFGKKLEFDLTFAVKGFVNVAINYPLGCSESKLQEIITKFAEDQMIIGASKAQALSSIFGGIYANPALKEHHLDAGLQAWKKTRNEFINNDNKEQLDSVNPYTVVGTQYILSIVKKYPLEFNQFVSHKKSKEPSKDVTMGFMEWILGVFRLQLSLLTPMDAKAKDAWSIGYILGFTRELHYQRGILFVDNDMVVLKSVYRLAYGSEEKIMSMLADLYKADDSLLMSGIACGMKEVVDWQDNDKSPILWPAYVYGHFDGKI